MDGNSIYQYLKRLLPDSVIIDVVACDEVAGRLYDINPNKDYCIIFNEQNSWQRYANLIVKV